MNSEATIYLFDDNVDDFAAIKRAFELAECNNIVRHFFNGEDALQTLESMLGGSDSGSGFPRLIPLDISLSGMSGHVDLEKIKSNPVLKLIPVVMLSSSGRSSSVSRAYAKGANSYLVKPISFDSLVKSLRQTYEYWFDVAVLPKTKR